VAEEEYLERAGQAMARGLYWGLVESLDGEEVASRATLRSIEEKVVSREAMLRGRKSQLESALLEFEGQTTLEEQLAGMLRRLRK
jgi:hypothetical protein